MHTRRFVMLGLPAAVMSCGAAAPVWAPDDLVQRSVYRHPGDPALTLFTMRRRSSDFGEHTGLMVNASQRVLFDPAGTFGGINIAERNDVIFGMTPDLERYYISYHSRETYYVERQHVVVAPEVAAKALALVQSYGAVPKTYCTRATASILQQLPGFGYIRSTLFPGKLAEQFAEHPGVSTTTYYEEDSDDKSIARAAYDAKIKSTVTQ